MVETRAERERMREKTDKKKRWNMHTRTHIQDHVMFSFHHTQTYLNLIACFCTRSGEGSTLPELFVYRMESGRFGMLTRYVLIWPPSPKNIHPNVHCVWHMHGSKLCSQRICEWADSDVATEQKKAKRNTLQHKQNHKHVIWSEMSSVK